MSEARKIKVLEMIDRPFLGGGQITLLRLARYLDRNRFDVAVCSAGGGPLDEELERFSIRHIPARFGKRFSFRAVRDIAGILKSNRIGILHTHGGIAGFYGRWAARRAGTPAVVHTLHGIHYLHYRNRLLKLAFIRLERVFSRSTDAVICVSEADRRSALSHGLAPAGKLAVIRNGMDFQGLGKAEDPAGRKREIGAEPSDPLIGTIARLHRQKGIMDLVKAADIVFREFLNAKFVVVGGGPLKDDMEREIRKRGLGGRFLLLGERKDAIAILSLFDVFVLPSLWEGLPYALVEAAALGKPIVATAVDGVMEVLRNDETGLLVPPADPESLASAILRLLKDRDSAHQLGRRALAEIPPQFELTRMIEETERLYLSLWNKSQIVER